MGLAVAAASLFTSGFLVLMQTLVLRRTGSTAIAADRAHYLTDVAVNLAVLVALAMAWATGWARVDPAFALAIALYMLWSASGIARAASVQLLDRELAPEQRKLIKRRPCPVPAPGPSTTSAVGTQATAFLSTAWRSTAS